MRCCNLKAYAKINLGLDVTGKREDGYHEVRMVMQTVNLYDTLFIKEIDRNAIVIRTNKAFLPVNESNIVYKAASLMKETYGLEKGFFIDLKKHIPVAAGMAGGSADAAATMVGINNMYRMGISMSRLMELGVKIGADVPYCIMRGTALAEGIGEKLTGLEPMPECHILIAKPPISVSTKAVYGKLDLREVAHPDIDGMIESLKAGSLSGIAGRLMNVLESVTVADHPVITDYKEEMIRMGAMGALMSGSGPTVFGIFEDRDIGLAAKRALKEKYPSAYVGLTRPFNLRGRDGMH